MRAQNRLLAILECLGAESPLTLNEVTIRSEVPKPTVLRILRDLESTGWVVRSRTNSYSLGPAVLSLAQRFLLAGSLVGVAGRLMEALRDETQETVSLSTKSGDVRLCVAEYASPHSLRYVHEVGSVGPLHTGASGRALLAALADETIEAALSNALRRYTDATPVDPDFLRSDVEQTRRRGWTISFGERYPGSTAVAVPLNDPITGAPYSLAIFAPESRYETSLGEVWARLLTTCADDIVRARQLQDLSAASM